MVAKVYIIASIDNKSVQSRPAKNIGGETRNIEHPPPIVSLATTYSAAATFPTLASFAINVLSVLAVCRLYRNCICNNGSALTPSAASNSTLFSPTTVYAHSRFRLMPNKQYPSSLPTFVVTGLDIQSHLSKLCLDE